YPSRPAVDTLRRVPVETRQVQLLGSSCGIECLKHAADPRDVRYTQSARVAGLEISLELPVAETSYHRLKCDAAAANVKCHFTAAPVGDRLGRSSEWKLRQHTDGRGGSVSPVAIPRAGGVR